MHHYLQQYCKSLLIFFFQRFDTYFNPSLREANISGTNRTPSWSGVGKPAASPAIYAGFESQYEQGTVSLSSLSWYFFLEVRMKKNYS
jgi:hypothetical protein